MPGKKAWPDDVRRRSLRCSNPGDALLPPDMSAFHRVLEVDEVADGKKDENCPIEEYDEVFEEEEPLKEADALFGEEKSLKRAGELLEEESGNAFEASRADDGDDCPEACVEAVEVERDEGQEAGDFEVFHSFQHLFIMETGSTTSLNASLSSISATSLNASLPSLPNISPLKSSQSFDSQDLEDFAKDAAESKNTAEDNIRVVVAEGVVDINGLVDSNEAKVAAGLKYVEAPVEAMDQSIFVSDVSPSSSFAPPFSSGIARFSPPHSPFHNAASTGSGVGDDAKRSPKRSISAIFDDDPDLDSDSHLDNDPDLGILTRPIASQQSKSITPDTEGPSSSPMIRQLATNPTTNETTGPTPPLTRQMALQLSQDVNYAANSSDSNNNDNTDKNDDPNQLKQSDDDNNDNQSKSPPRFIEARAFSKSPSPRKFPPVSDSAYSTTTTTTKKDTVRTNAWSMTAYDAAGITNEATAAIKAASRASSSSSSGPLRDSPKRPSEEPLEEEGKISPKRQSLQFRPDRISSTSTPFGGSRPILPSAKGIRALSFDLANGSNNNNNSSNNNISNIKEENTQHHNHPQHPNRKARLSFNPDETFSLQSIAEHVENPSFPTKSAKDDPNDQSSIIAHGFPSSFFYSPAMVEARSTSGAAAAAVSPSTAAAAAAASTSKQRRSMPPNIAVFASPSTQRFREALSAEISRRRVSLSDQPSTIRRLSLDEDRHSSTSGPSIAPSTSSSASSSSGIVVVGNASSGDGFAPFSPSKHPMMTRSSASVVSLKDPEEEEEEMDESKWPLVSKASLYSLYEALSQVMVGRSWPIDKWTSVRDVIIVICES